MGDMTALNVSPALRAAAVGNIQLENQEIRVDTSIAIIERRLIHKSDLKEGCMMHLHLL